MIRDGVKINDDPIPRRQPYVRYMISIRETKEDDIMPVSAMMVPVNAVMRMPILSTSILAMGDMKKVVKICREPIQAGKRIKMFKNL